MLLNTAALDTAVLNGAAANTQSLAAGISAACSVTAGLSKSDNLAASLSVVSSSSGGLTNQQPIASSISVASSASGLTTDTIPLGASVGTAAYGIAALYDTIPLAALVGTAAVSNIVKADTSVAYQFDSSISVASAVTGNARANWVIGGQAQSQAIASGYDLVNYVIAGASSVSTQVTGDMPLTIALTAGKPSNTVGDSTLGSFALNGGESFTKAGSTATGTAIIVFAASAQISCQSYAIGALYDTIPLADLVGTGALSNIINGDLGLTVNLGGTANATSATTADVNLVHQIASSISVSATDAATASVVKGLGGNVSIAGNAIPAITSVHYVIDSAAKVAASVNADVNLVKPIQGSSAASVTTSGKTSVHYVISASVLTLVTTSADLHKTDNLQDMEGTGAISNIAYANVMLRKPLGGAGLALVAIDGRLVSAHTVDADIASGATANAELIEIQLDLSVGEVFVEVDDITYITSDYEIWPSQQVA